eukprot:gene12279-2921_t
MLPFSKRTYSFRAGDVKEANKDNATPIRKIKSRGRTFIGSKTPNENTQEEAGFPLTPFTRGSVRLKSIRKRKMASRDDVKNDETSFKRGKMVGKGSDEIEVKIEENIRMRDGVTKLLSGCHDTRQAMEIGKNLLTINSRVLSLMSSLQKKRSSNILKDYNKNHSRSVPADFKLEIEAYYSVVQNPDNPAWTPMRTPKKSVYSSAPHYCLVAHSQLTVNDIKEGFVVSDFTMGGVGASATAVLGHDDDFPDNPLSLWGHFSCQLHARPKCLLEQKLDGHLLFQSANGGQPVWEKYYCRLRNCTIQCWKQFPLKDEGFTMNPGMSIRLRKGMKIRVEKSTDDSNRGALILTSKKAEEKEPVFAFESDDDFKSWENGLQQALVDIKAWKAACYTLVNIEEFEAKKKAFNKALNSFEQNVVNTDIRQMSPVLARKSTKTSSKASLSFSEITPKVRSFYDQINIASVKDNVDSGIVSNGENQENPKIENASETIDNDASSVEGSDRLETNAAFASGVEENKNEENAEDMESTDVDKAKEEVEIDVALVDEKDEIQEVSNSIEEEDKSPPDSDKGEIIVSEDSCEDEQTPVAEEASTDENIAQERSAVDMVLSSVSQSTEKDGVLQTIEDDKSSASGSVSEEVAISNGEEEPETEESVLDYLVEAIDSAAHLDESTDSCLENADVTKAENDNKAFDEELDSTSVNDSPSDNTELNGDKKLEDIGNLDNTESVHEEKEIDMMQSESLTSNDVNTTRTPPESVVENIKPEVNKEGNDINNDDLDEDSSSSDHDNVVIDQSCEETKTCDTNSDNNEESDNFVEDCQAKSVSQLEDLEKIQSCDESHVDEEMNEVDLGKEVDSKNEVSLDEESIGIEVEGQACTVAESLESSLTNNKEVDTELDTASSTTSSSVTATKVETEV